MTVLDLTSDWPVPAVSGAVLHRGVVVETVGDIERTQRLASISKPLTAWATLVAVEEGIVDLDQPIDERGATLRHLLAHAAGYPFNGTTPITLPETTRIYSNSGIELVAATVEHAASMPFAEYLHAAVFEPLAMGATELRGSPAHGVWSSVADLCTFIVDVLTPRLITPATAAEATRIHYPELAGIVPGVGRYDRCPWGLGFEVRGEKHPHWTGATNSPRTFGHFGGSGTMCWIDPVADVALVTLADLDFDAWALQAWPQLSDAVVAEYATPAGRLG